MFQPVLLSGICFNLFSFQASVLTCSLFRFLFLPLLYFQVFVLTCYFSGFCPNLLYFQVFALTCCLILYTVKVFSTVSYMTIGLILCSYYYCSFTMRCMHDALLWKGRQRLWWHLEILVNRTEDSLFCHWNLTIPYLGAEVKPVFTPEYDNLSQHLRDLCPRSLSRSIMMLNCHRDDWSVIATVDLPSQQLICYCDGIMLTGTSSHRTLHSAFGFCSWTVCI